MRVSETKPFLKFSVNAILARSRVDGFDGHDHDDTRDHRGVGGDEDDEDYEGKDEDRRLPMSLTSKRVGWSVQSMNVELPTAELA